MDESSGFQFSVLLVVFTIFSLVKSSKYIGKNSLYSLKFAKFFNLNHNV
jgi:hypothetical protein